ncbi:MAG: hypothetical protein AB1439_08495 [candidate division FCPU426 bacterium]
MTFKPGLALAVLAAAAGCLLPLTAGAAWEAGAGMEYFTLHTQFEDGVGQKYDTVLQSTLTHARVSWAEAGWLATLAGGWSDWNVSGEWDIPGQPRLSAEPFYWVGQDQWTAEVLYRFFGGFTAGARYTHRNLTHYEGPSHYTFMRYQEQYTEGLLGYQWQVTPSLTLSALAGYAPWTGVDFFESIYFTVLDIEVIRYATQRTGSRWQGLLGFRYRDSAGWGLELQYSLSRSVFSGTPVLNAVSGSIAGALILMF